MAEATVEIANESLKQANKSVARAQEDVDYWSDCVRHKKKRTEEEVSLEAAQKQFDEAYERLKEAQEHQERILNEARAAAEKANRATKKQRVAAEIDLPNWSKYLAVAQELSLEESDVGKLVHVPGTIFSTDFRNGVCNGLFIRQEYVDVDDIINKKLSSDDGSIDNGSIKRVLVVGSPGIGKSVFGVLLFLLAIKQKKNVAYHPLDDDRTYYFTWIEDENKHEITDSPCAETNYDGYFDGTESKSALNFNLFNRVFLFASPRSENYNNFVKQRCFKVYLNPWSKEECRALAESIQFEDDEEWLRSFISLEANQDIFFRRPSALRVYMAICTMIFLRIPTS